MSKPILTLSAVLIFLTLDLLGHQIPPAEYKAPPEIPAEYKGLRIWAWVPDTPVAKAGWGPDPSRADQRRMVRICVFLTNAGQESLRVPTAKWAFTYGTGLTSYSIIMDFMEPKLFGIQSIPSEVSYAPVELKAGECTIIELKTEVPLGMAIEQMSIRYLVTPYLKERLGFWSGDIKCPLTMNEPKQ